MTKPFTNPYPCAKYEVDDPDKKTVRLQSRVLAKDYAYLCGLRLSKGTATTVVNILWQKLTLACKAQGFVDSSDQSAFETFVANCDILYAQPNTTRNSRRTKVSGRSDSGTAGEPSAQANGRPVKRPRNKVTRTSEQPTIHASQDAGSGATEGEANPSGT